VHAGAAAQLRQRQGRFADLEGFHQRERARHRNHAAFGALRASFAALRMPHHGPLCETALYCVQRGPTVRPSGHRTRPFRRQNPCNFPAVPRWPSRPAQLLAATAHAQAWPAKPIRLIVPFPAGGGTDIISREVANKISGPGYTFVVDNKPGSGGNLGVDAAAKSPRRLHAGDGPDQQPGDQPDAVPKLPYDPLKDLTPISLVASAPLVIVASADSPFKTLADVVKEAKAKPGSINFATSGNGTVAHLAPNPSRRPRASSSRTFRTRARRRAPPT
jgi:hypothetical protein